MFELFEAQVQRAPEAVAVEFAGERLTYRDLNARANQLAHHLRVAGVGPDVLVALQTGRTAAFVTAVVGILKAGGAYLPLDPEYPAERLRYMFADAEAAVLVRDGDVPRGWTNTPCHVVDLQGDATTLASASTDNPAPLNEPGHAAYVLYTSGSSGRPKGVCMSHGALLNLVHWQGACSSGGTGQRTLQFAPLGFDVCFQEIFSTLSAGGTLVIPPARARRDFSALVRLIEEARIQRLFLPCVALEYMAQAAQETGRVPETLREVIVAGEQLRITPVVRALFQKLEGARLVNQYGPTEAHVVSAFELTGDPASWPYWPPIGRPVANTQLYILDSALEPVPAGVDGELFIGGVQVARGYWRQPELTADRFIPDPFSPSPSGRLYRTGDLARRLPDGNIEFVGRSDDQVKIRGFRVELGEIESALAQHPGVRQSVVAAVEDAAANKALVAYIVPAEGVRASAGALKDFLKEQLPAHMVPMAFVFLSAFPLSPNGKVDRRALPPHHRDESEPDHVAPRNDLERQVLEVWQNVLQQDRIGVHDNFCDLGGHSLLAMRLITEINRALNVNLEALTLFDNPTVEQLTAAVVCEKEEVRKPKIAPVHPGGEGAPLLFLWRNAPIQTFARAHIARWRQPVWTTEIPFTRETPEDAARFDKACGSTVEAMAAAHTGLIQAAGLGGPFLLSGYSYGGVLAFEVGHQLLRLGHAVEAVFIFDSDRHMRDWERLQWYARQCVTRGPGYVWRKMGAHLSGGAARGARPAPDIVGGGLSMLDPEARWELIDHMWAEASKRYRFRPLACRGVLFKARESLYGERHDFDGCLGWRRLFAKGLDVIEVPTSHYSMWREPDVHALVERWNAALETLHRQKAD